MDEFGPIVWIAFAVGAIVLGIFGYIQEQKRIAALVEEAQRLGLHFRKGKDRSLGRRYDFLDKLRSGSNRYAQNVLSGAYQQQPVEVFGYHYETHSTDSKGRRQTHHHYLHVTALTMEYLFPELRIYPESFFSKIGQALGFDDIDFESVEFSKKFVVKSTDKKFAYDICHTRMMEFLLKHPQICLEIEGHTLALIYNGKLDPARIKSQLELLLNIRALFPAYILDQQH